MTETSDYRMIALDLDGTLLDPQARVRPRLKQAVHQLVSCGWTVCFATGRSYLESQPVLEQVDHYDLGVFIGGAVLVDTRNGATLFQQKMQPVLAKEISGQLENLGHAVLALQDSSAAGADYYATAGVALNAATTHWMQHFNARVTRIGSLGNFDHAHTIRLGIVGSTGQTSQAQQLLKERFGSNVLVHSLRVSSDVEVLECFDPSVNKWEGIRRIARQRDIMESQIITVGDDSNDQIMIQSAGLGVAMGNAKPQIKAVAKRVIGTNSSDSLAEFLEQMANTESSTICSCEDPR